MPLTVCYPRGRVTLEQPHATSKRSVWAFCVKRPGTGRANHPHQAAEAAAAATPVTTTTTTTTTTERMWSCRQPFSARKLYSTQYLRFAANLYACLTYAMIYRSDHFWAQRIHAYVLYKIHNFSVAAGRYPRKSIGTRQDRVGIS